MEHATPPGTATPKKGKCGAYLRKSEQKYGTKRYCSKPKMQGKTRCKLHGGKSLAGVASATYKGKGHSKSLPTQLADRYSQAQHDPQLMEVRKTTAKIDAMLEERWQQVLTGSGLVDGKEALKALNAFEAELNQDLLETELALGDQCPPRKKLVKGLAALRAAIEPIKDLEAAQAHVERLAEQKRKFTETHHKNMQLTAQTFSLQEIGTLVGVLAASVKQQVKDKPTLGRIFEVFDKNMKRYEAGETLQLEGEVVEDVSH